MTIYEAINILKSHKEACPTKLGIAIDTVLEQFKECKCFRLGVGSPWQIYLCEIHRYK